MGVQFFGGKFFKCVNEMGELLPITVSILVDVQMQLHINQHLRYY